MHVIVLNGSSVFKNKVQRRCSALVWRQSFLRISTSNTRLYNIYQLYDSELILCTRGRKGGCGEARCGANVLEESPGGLGPIADLLKRLKALAETEAVPALGKQMCRGHRRAGLHQVQVVLQGVLHKRARVVLGRNEQVREGVRCRVSGFSAKQFMFSV